MKPLTKLILISGALVAVKAIFNHGREEATRKERNITVLKRAR